MKKSQLNEMIVQEAFLDKFIDKLGKTIKDKKVDQVLTKVEKDDPKLADAMKDLQNSFNKVQDMWDDYGDLESELDEIKQAS